MFFRWFCLKKTPIVCRNRNFIYISYTYIFDIALSAKLCVFGNMNTRPNCYLNIYQLKVPTKYWSSENNDLFGGFKWNRNATYLASVYSKYALSTSTHLCDRQEVSCQFDRNWAFWKQNSFGLNFLHHLFLKVLRHGNMEICWCQLRAI